MPMDYYRFFRQVIERIVDQEKSNMEIYEAARQFVFQIYDINGDSIIEQCDLFAYIKEVKNEETFVAASYRDIQDIQRLLNSR